MGMNKNEFSDLNMNSAYVTFIGYSGQALYMHNLI